MVRRLGGAVGDPRHRYSRRSGGRDQYGTPRHRGCTGHRRRGCMGDAGSDRHPHALRRRGSRHPGADRVASPRRDHSVHRVVLAVDDLRQRGGGGRPLRARRSDPARPRHLRGGRTQGLVVAEGVCRTVGGSAARGESRCIHRTFGHADVCDGSRSCDTIGCTTHTRGAGTDGGDARRRARRGIRRTLVAAAQVRQARRRDMSVTHPAVDVRQTQRAAPTQEHAAPQRPSAAVGTRHPEPAQSAVADGAVDRLRAPCAEDVAAVCGRREVERESADPDGPPYRAHQSLGRRLPLAAPAGAVRGVCGRYRSGDLRGIRFRRSGIAPA